MTPGTRVRMAESFKDSIKRTLERPFIALDREHIEEFGDCIGEVLGPTFYGNQLGPEVDVRWFPSGLRYAYAPENLEVVREGGDRTG